MAPGGATRAVAEDGQLNPAPSEVVGFARGRRPDIDLLSAHRATSVGHQIFSAVVAGFDAYSAAQGQNRWIGGNHSFDRPAATGGTSIQTVGGGQKDECGHGWSFDGR